MKNIITGTNANENNNAWLFFNPNTKIIKSAYIDLRP